MSEKVVELAARVQGTCLNVDDELVDLPLEDLAKFDDLVFNCTGCGWWFETNDAVDTDDGYQCVSCAESD